MPATTHAPFRFPRRRPLAAMALIAAVPGALALAAFRSAPLSATATDARRAAAAPTAAAPATTARAAYAAHFAEFQGVGAEGRDMVWRGAIAGAAVGELTVRLAHIAPDGAARPGAQPVEGILFVSGAPARSFAAELTGTMDLGAKRVEVGGTISEGYRRGERVEYAAELVDFDLSGELRFVPLLARAPGND